MADTTSGSAAPRKRRSWLRALAWVVGIIIVLLVVVYFVATSSAFFTGVILPKVGKAMHAQVTVSSASISPFSQVVLEDLKVQTTGAEPLLTAKEVRARYHLMDILHGNINVDEVAVASPTVIVVQNPDGSSNLEPITQSQQGKPQAATAQPSKPARIDLKKLALTDATVRQVKLYKNGSRAVMELSHVNVTVDNVQNGQSGKLDLAAEVALQDSGGGSGTNSTLQAKLSGSFGFALTADLKPASVKGNASLDVGQATGAWAEINSAGATLDCEVSPTDIKQVVMRFQRSGTPLGEVRVSGPFDMAKTEGRLSVAVSSIDKNLLNLAGAKSGLDFGRTVLNSTNQVEMTKGGKSIAAAGRLTIGKFEVKRANEITPPLDLQALYDVSVDLVQSNCLVREFNLTGTQQDKPLLKAELTSPMQVAWGKAANAVGDSTFKFIVADLNLRDWKPFLGSLEPEGTVNAQLKLLSQQAGQELTFDLNSQIENLSATLGSNHISRAGVELQVNGKATALTHFDLKQYELKVAQQSQPVLTVAGSGTYDQGTTNADLQMTAQAMLVPLLRLVPQPDADITSGSVEFKGHVVQKQSAQSVTGTVALSDLTGRYGKNAFKAYGATMDLDAGMTPQQVQLRKLAGKLTEGSKPGGSFELTGTCNLSTKAAQFAVTLADFNQYGLRAFLEPMLNDKQLVSVSLNGKASAQYDPKVASSVKADMQVSNLVVRDPKNSFPAKPLGAGFRADASLLKNVADIRELRLTLTPTQRAKNELLLAGRVDMSDTNAYQGQIKLSSDALDLTSYYDLFTGEKKPQQAGATRATGAPSSAAAPQREPEPTKLPLRNFTAVADIRRLYLREVEVADFQATKKIDGGHVVLNPCKLTLNGAPAGMTLDLDMGVPGYKYDLTLNGQKIPLPPLIDSFQPERKGQMSGTVSVHVQVKGEGITDASIQKNLASQFDVSLTNLNLNVVNIKSALLKTVVNVVSLVPDLVRNPLGAGTHLLGAVLNPAGTTGGLADEMQKAPIDSIALRGKVGSGVLALQQGLVQSAAFQANAQGTVTLAVPLTNSILQVPVTVSLSRSLAERMNMLPANTPTNAAYVALPQFLTVKGSVGKPQPDVNKLALAGTVLSGVGSSIPGTGGGLLQGLGGLLRENPPRQNSNTNAPATNQAPINSLLDGLLGPRKK